jgi:hypothetical protein
MTKHLPILSILHYVYGACLCVGGLAAVFIIGVGAFLSSDLLAADDGEQVPTWVGGIIQAFGTTILLLVELWGVLNLLSGYWIDRGINRTGSMIIAAMNCLSVPIGLALGIFTLITIASKEVEEAYTCRM